MEWLNYHHLLYFWMVAKEGGLAPAAAKLRLSQPTLSAQVHALETRLGEKLFAKQGRKLVLTESGHVAFGYAEDIFSTGQELLDAFSGRGQPRMPKLSVGVADVVPKLIAQRLLAPAQHLAEPVRIVIQEDKPERLLGELAVHQLDVVISDAPPRAGLGVRVFSHLLGECGVGLFGVPALAKKYGKRFPKLLNDAPMLLPIDGSPLRRALDRFFEEHKLRPRVIAEVEDSALLNAFGQDGSGMFAAPLAIESEIKRQYRVERVGVVPDVIERYYALTVERRIKHPAVVAISHSARNELFK